MRLVGLIGGIETGKSTVSSLFKANGIAVVDADLVARAKMDIWTKPIIVVWVDPDTQLYRLMNRDGTSEEDAKNRIDAQMPLYLKRRKADIVIDNNGSLEDLNENFRKVLDQVMKPGDMD